MAEFKVGDTVQLNSGGPGMTVVGLSANDEATCTWFEKGKALKEIFPAAALQSYAPPKTLEELVSNSF